MGIDGEGNDIRITWTTIGGKTNVVQAVNGLGDGSFNTNFADISLPIIGPGTGVLTTNYLDVGAIEDSPSRYYRIRLVP